jgi:hypothetical protein
VECELDGFVQKIVDTLAAPSSRGTIVENAYNLIDSDLTMTRMAGLCLQKIRNLDN